MNRGNEVSLLGRIIKNTTINSDTLPFNLKKNFIKKPVNESKNQQLIKQTNKNKEKKIPKNRNHNLHIFINSLKKSKNSNNSVSKSTFHINKKIINPKKQNIFYSTMKDISYHLKEKTAIKPYVKKRNSKSQILSVESAEEIKQIKKIKKLPRSNNYLKSDKNINSSFFENSNKLNLKLDPSKLKKNKDDINYDKLLFLQKNNNNSNKLILKSIDKGKYLSRNMSNSNINCDNTSDIYINILSQTKNDNNTSIISKNNSDFFKDNKRFKNSNKVKKLFNSSINFANSSLFLCGNNDKENDSCNIVNISIGNISITKQKSNNKNTKENKKEVLLNNENENSISKNNISENFKKGAENESHKRKEKRVIILDNQNTNFVEENRIDNERTKSVKINSPKRDMRNDRYKTGTKRNIIKINLDEYYKEEKQKISLINCDNVNYKNIPNIENEKFYTELKHGININFSSVILDNKITENKLKTILYKKKQIESLIKKTKNHDNFNQTDMNEIKIEFFEEYKKVNKETILKIKNSKSNEDKKLREDIIFSGGIKGGINKYILSKNKFDKISFLSIKSGKCICRRSINMDSGVFLKKETKINMIQKKNTIYQNYSNRINKLNQNKNFPILKTNIFSRGDKIIYKNILNLIFIQNLIIRTIVPFICKKEKDIDINFEENIKNKCVQNEFQVKCSKSRKSTIKALCNNSNYLSPRKKYSGNTMIVNNQTQSKSFVNLNKIKVLKKKNFFNQYLIKTVDQTIKRMSSIKEYDIKLSYVKNKQNSTNSYELCKELYWGLYCLIIDRDYDLFVLKIEEFKNLIDINYKMYEGNTFLIVCAKEGCLKLVKFLCKKNCDLNIQNEKGNTALHYAIANQFFDIVDVLIKYGAKEDIFNYKGLSPWDCIKHNLD